MPHRLHVPRARQLQAAQADFGRAMHLTYRIIDIAVGQTRQPDQTVGCVAAKILQPVVVNAKHFHGGFLIAQTRRRAEDAEDHLGIHAVHLGILDTQRRIGGAALAVFFVVIEKPGLVHAIHAVILSRHQLRAGRADPAHQAVGISALRRPVRPVGPIRHVRHALLERGAGVRGKQIRRQPRQINMAVGRDAVVLHGVSSLNRTLYLI